MLLESDGVDQRHINQLNPDRISSVFDMER